MEDVRPAVLPNLSELSRAERIDALRSRMSTMGAAVPNLSTSAVEIAVDKEDILAAPSTFSQLLPGGGLPRRAVTCVSDQPLLIVEFLAHITAQGGHAAVIGWKDLAFAGVLDSGGACENIIAIPEPGTEPLNVAAVLCEGLDVVVYKGPEISLSPSRARPLLGKLRQGTAALVMVGTKVASPALTVDSEITNYVGIGAGQGRIRGVEMQVRTMSKSFGARSGTVTISRAQDSELLQEKKPTFRVVS
ncbi:hypothetical protein CDES_03175 [Corynebacterium deserti GIMN1.010]|uniref:Uncharacterized protein n=1 Tax=Corynebacterium deserti GIMN1.010 TaxID=931089 RepID=A0A0M4CI44_9CORY|nr:hypothetical protein CDES_03175 [Corynebacterium deserti GIMN1.010]